MRSFGRSRRIFLLERNQVWLALLDLYEAILLERFGQAKRSRQLAQRAQYFFALSEFPGKAITADLFLARLDLQAGDCARAFQACQPVLERLRHAPFPSLQFQATQLWAEILESMGLISAARQAYESAHQTLEELRFRLRGDELKIAFLKDKHSIYESLFLLTLQTDSRSLTADAAFAIAERAKSRSLLEAVGAGASPKEAGLSQIRRELDMIYQQIQKLEPGAEQDNTESLRQQAQRLEAGLAGRALAESALSKTLGQVQSQEAMSGSTLREQLPADTQVLEYYVARSSLFAIVMSRSACEIVPLGSMREVEATTRFLRFHLQAPQPDERILTSHLQSLYRYLIAPVASRLLASRVVIVPHGILHTVPFAALHDGSASLLDRFILRYSPSASLLLAAEQRPASTAQESLIVGVEDLAAPGFLEEARQVAELLPNPRRLFAGDATTAQFLAAAPHARRIHIAAHGVFRRSAPMFSYMQLANSRLTAFDLQRLSLQADLAVLSGCSTGLTNVVGADEVMGLVRSLLVAGVRTAVLSHWDVRDAAAVDFVRNFYQVSLTDNLPPDEAVREASLILRTTYGQVRDWAAFAVYGSARKS